MTAHAGGAAGLVALALSAAARPALAQALAPPPPLGPTVAPSGGDDEEKRRQTAELLDRAEREDNGRPLTFFYGSAGGGAGYVHLAGFSDKGLGVPQPKGGAGGFDVGAGVTLVLFTVGARARLLSAAGFSLWQLYGEGAYHLPSLLGASWDTAVGVRAGYVFSGSVNGAGLAAPADAAKGVSLSGFGAGAEVAEDYYVVPFLSVGAAAGFDALFLQRAALAPGPTGAPVTDPTLARGGSSSGYAFTVDLRVGVHL